MHVEEGARQVMAMQARRAKQAPPRPWLGCCLAAGSWPHRAAARDLGPTRVPQFLNYCLFFCCGGAGQSGPQVRPLALHQC